MKQLQNNFTTLEQSKRLLELGVPAESADCYFGSYPGHPDWAVIRQSEFDTEDDALFRLNEDIIPCWSVGRLREIFCICSSADGTREYPFCNSQVSWWISEFEFKKEFIDFSKLED